VVRVGWIVDKATALFDPDIHGIPRDERVARRLRHALVGQVTDLLSGEGIGKCASGAMDEEGRFSIKHRLATDESLNAPTVRLDVDQPRW
jgi:hypothetical protein